MSFADKIIDFNRSLELNIDLPSNIGVMNPFRENPEALKASGKFYKKYYNDNNSRSLILGINPGRFGAGVTGIPFTDTKRLENNCGIKWEMDPTHETSSVFVYEVIDAYGGPEIFYSDFFINSVSPLGFVIKDEKGKEKNYNYYDSKALLQSVEPFIIHSIREMLNFGINTDTCFCLGTNKNYNYLKQLNERKKFFNKIIPLEHPRFIMQYRLKKKDVYINKYLDNLKSIL